MRKWFHSPSGLLAGQRMNHVVQRGRCVHAVPLCFVGDRSGLDFKSRVSPCPFMSCVRTKDALLLFCRLLDVTFKIAFDHVIAVAAFG